MVISFKLCVKSRKDSGDSNDEMCNLKVQDESVVLFRSRQLGCDRLLRPILFLK